MSELGLVRPDMEAIVGTPYGVQVSYPVTASDIRRWAQAIYYPERPPAAYLDPAAAEDGRLLAPLDFNAFAWGAAHSFPSERKIPIDAKLRSVGAMEHFLGVDPPKLFHALNGGVAATYTGVRIRPGDVITSESVIAGYLERESRRLGPILLTHTDTTWTNQQGELIKTSRMTLIRY